MEIIVNGERRAVPDGLTVAALLEFLEMRSHRVAIERNREILPRAQWPATHVQPNDSFEIVQFVGGGEHAGLRFEKVPDGASLADP